MENKSRLVRFLFSVLFLFISTGFLFGQENLNKNAINAVTLDKFLVSNFDSSLVLKYLVPKGSHVNAVDFNTGNSALLNAVMYRDISAVRVLLDAGADINLKNKKGSTALHIALANHSTAIAKLLIFYNADVNAVNDNGFTAAMYAIANYNTELTKLLIKKGANLKYINKFGLQAIDYIEKDVDSDFYNLVYLNTLTANELYLANYFEFLENKISENLIDINAVDANGRSVLFYALKDRNLDMIKYFLSNGANPNIIDNKLNSPLRIANSLDNTKYAKVIKAYGGKILYDKFSPELRQITMLNNLKKNKLEFIVLNSYDNDTLNTLLSDSSVLSYTDNKGNNILHIAVLRNRTDIVKILLASDFNGDISNYEGYTPVDLALKVGNDHIYKYFKYYGYKSFAKKANDNKIDEAKFYLPDFNGNSLSENIDFNNNDKLNHFIAKGYTPVISKKVDIDKSTKIKLNAVGAYNQVYFNDYLSSLMVGTFKKLFYYDN